MYVNSSFLFFPSWSSQTQVHRDYRLQMKPKQFGCFLFFFPELVRWVLPSHIHDCLTTWAVNSNPQGHHSLDPACLSVGVSQLHLGSFSKVQSKRTENSCPLAFPLTACSTTSCQYTDQPCKTKVSVFIPSFKKQVTSPKTLWENLHFFHLAREPSPQN